MSNRWKINFVNSVQGLNHRRTSGNAMSMCLLGRGFVCVCVHACVRACVYLCCLNHGASRGQGEEERRGGHWRDGPTPNQCNHSSYQTTIHCGGGSEQRGGGRRRGERGGAREREREREGWMVHSIHSQGPCSLLLHPPSTFSFILP